MLELNFIPFPILSTQRLLLRNITEDDVEEIFIQRSHPVIRKYIKRPPAANQDEALQFIQKINKQQENNEVITWALVLKGEKKLIGTVCYWNIEVKNDKAEIGYNLHPDYFSKGIMKEALVEILNYGFNTMRLKTIDAYTNKDNQPSLGLLQNLGFIRNRDFEEKYVDKEELEYNVVYTLRSKGNSREI